jgi:type III secretory pathway lipoprotein EscJ
MSDWRAVFEGPSEWQAELVKAVLEEHDIQAVVLNLRDRSYGNFGRVRVMVEESDFDQAMMYLRLSPPNP